MSYKNKKKRKKLSSRLMYKVDNFRIVLLKIARKFLPNKGRKEKNMYLPQTRKVMSFLRTQRKLIRSDNKKIETWVDDYVNRCAASGKPVQILTQWCVSKDLIERRDTQGGEFVPLKAEIKLIRGCMPKILEAFFTNSFRVDWWITFNCSYLDSFRISPKITREYLEMVQELIESVKILSDNSIVLDWEEEVLGGRPMPNSEITNSFESTVPKTAFKVDLENLSRAPDFSGMEPEIVRETVKFKIACEAEEGKFLCGKDSPFPNGEVIIIPLEFSERVWSFELLSPGFSQRIAAVLKPYPWRTDADKLSYKK